MKNIPVGTEKIFPYIAAGVLIFTAAGCATKKYVRTTVAPLETRVEKTEAKNAEQSTAIDTLETDLSKTKERVQDVDAQAKSAAQAATAADNHAGQAASAAEGARQVAEKGLTRVDGLQRTVEEWDKLRPLTIESVRFPFDSATLTEEAKSTLDGIAHQFQGKDRFVIELQGFTDRTGHAAYNLALSRQRAEAVARYLTLQHKVPLRDIHLIGEGSESPVADNHSRDGRKMNRRVEVKVFVPVSDQQAAVVVSSPE